MNESAELPVTSTCQSYLPIMQQASELLGGCKVSHVPRVVGAQRTLEWMTSVIVCLCTFSLLVPPQVATLLLSSYAESECPAEEDGETTERELVAASSRRRRCEDHRSHDLLCQGSSADHINRTVAYAAPDGVKTGHQLANGLAAPLLI